MRGKFITIEGGDGSGKSTQINALLDYLKSRGIEAYFTREPGGTEISEKIREIILDVKNDKMSDYTESLLYAAARSQHVYEKILPLLNAGKTVVCDRYVDSSFAYQGFARGLGFDFIEHINEAAIKGAMPDITIYLDIRPEIGILRKKSYKELDRLEKEKLDFHNKVYEGYNLLIEKYPDRFVKINAESSVEKVSKAVIEAVSKIL